MPVPKERSKLEIELNEKKLASEIEKLDLECARGRLMVAEQERSERNALSKSSEARIYNFVEQVSAGTVKQCVDTLNEWARRSTEPITIVFNSPGGQVFHGLALYDAVEELRGKRGIHFTTVCRGMAASMGGVLFQLGDKRIIGKNAYVLIHEVSDIASGTTSEIEDHYKLTVRLQKRLVGILAARSTCSEREIEKRWKKTDWWLDADECIEFGFADEIG